MCQIRIKQPKHELTKVELYTCMGRKMYKTDEFWSNKYFVENVSSAEAVIEYESEIEGQERFEEIRYNLS